MSIGRDHGRGLAVTGAAVLLAACLVVGLRLRPEVAPLAPRLVVLYAPCTVNARYLAPYRDEVFFTPSLRRFAADALVFERNQSESDQSGTAYAGLLTGRQATGHGVFAHPVQLADAPTTLAEAFAAAGWDTYFWAAQGMASARLGYAQGVPAQHVVQRPLAGDDPKLIEILDRVARDPGYRALIVTSFTVTHYPYKDRIAEMRADFPDATDALRAGLSDDAIRARTLQYQFDLSLQKDLPGAQARLGLTPDDVRELARVVELLYVSDVAYLDRLFGSVIAAIDARHLAPSALIAFTADHGELLYRDNALFPWSHEFQLAPEVLRTPLLLRGAGVRAGRYAGVTRSIDLYPTLAGLAGVPVLDAGVEGVDLARAVRGATEAPDLVAFSHTPKVRSDVVQRGQSQWQLFASYFPTTSIDEIWVSLRRGDLVAKLRKQRGGAFGFAVYDLATDPEERRDLYRADDPQHARLAQELRDYKRRLIAAHDGAEARAATKEVDAQQRDGLRALGYIE